MTEQDFEYLKTCVVLSIDKQDIPEDEEEEAHTEYTITLKSEWYHDSDTVHGVARILNHEGIFYGHRSCAGAENAVSNCIDYFEKPWKWNPEIKDLIKEYLEENKIEVK